MGILLNKKAYPILEYLEALAITGGVAMFTFSEKYHESEKVDTFYGTTLLALYLVCDSFTSQWQVVFFSFFTKIFFLSLFT